MDNWEYMAEMHGMLNGSICQNYILAVREEAFQSQVTSYQ
jgi:hypothetical protein